LSIPPPLAAILYREGICRDIRSLAFGTFTMTMKSWLAFVLQMRTHSQRKNAWGKSHLDTPFDRTHWPGVSRLPGTASWKRHPKQPHPSAAICSSAVAAITA